MTDQKLYSALAYAGALPFVGCALGIVLGLPVPAALGSWAAIAQSYGLTIVSFMAGILWGIQLTSTSDRPTRLFVVSNAVALAAWFAFLLGPPAFALVVMALLFAYLLIVDRSLGKQGILSPEYLGLRRNVTGIVVVALVVSAGAL